MDSFYKTHTQEHYALSGHTGCFMPTPTHRINRNLAESDLWYAILERAYYDLNLILRGNISNKEKSGCITPQEAKTAILYFLSPGEDFGSFIWVIGFCIHPGYRVGFLEKMRKRASLARAYIQNNHPEISIL